MRKNIVPGKRARAVAQATAKLADLDTMKGGRLKVCQDLMRLYVPTEPVPTSVRQCRAALELICVNIWDHIEGKGTVLSRAELRRQKRTNPFPLNEAKQSETLRCLLR